MNRLRTPSVVTRTVLWVDSILIAWLALALSGVSLLWQVITHVLSGDRVIVHLGTSIPVGGLEHLPICTLITAQNRGRTAVTVTAVALDVGAGEAAQIITQIVREISDPLPIRLEPGASASWAYPSFVDEKIRADHPHPRAMVSLGTGKKRYSRRS